jgi:hypothetical protein
LGSSRLAAAAISAIGLAIAVIIAEAALRGLDYPREQPVGWAWRGDPAEANEFGFRGHRAGERVDDTIILLGDPQVESQQPFGRMPEVFLSAALDGLTQRHVRVVSVAAFGWGQDQQLLALQRTLLEIRPRMVLLWLTPNNDLWNNTFPTHLPKDGWPKPTFWLEGDSLRGPHAAWGTAYRPPGLRLLRVVRPLLGKPMYVTDDEWEPRLPPAYRAPATKDGGTVSLVEYATRRFGLTREEVELVLSTENFDNEKTHVSIALTPRSPRLDYSIRLTRALLREITRLCASHRADFLAFYVDTGPTGAPEEPTSFDVSGRVLTLSNIAARGAIRELLADVPSLELKGHRPEFHMSRTNHHLNEAGNRYFMTEVARQIAAPLRSRRGD